MRKARFTEEQMVAMVREADREPVAVVAKRHGISEQTIYVWRQHCRGLFQTRSPLDWESATHTRRRTARIPSYANGALLYNPA